MLLNRLLWNTTLVRRSNVWTEDVFLSVLTSRVSITIMYIVDVLIGICWAWKCNDGHKSSWRFFEQQLCYWYKRKVQKCIYFCFAQTHLPSLTQMNQTTCRWNIMPRIQLNLQCFQFHGICLSARALALQMELSLGRRHAKLNWWIVRKNIDALCWLWESVAILQHLPNKLSWAILIQQW